MKLHAIYWAVALLVASPLAAQDRDTQVRNDRKEVGADKTWVYDDLDTGLAIAKQENKPLLVVFR